MQLRQAAAYAIKREEIVQAAFFGRGAPLGGMPVPPGTEFYDAALANIWQLRPGPREIAAARGRACRTASPAPSSPPRNTACTRRRREIVQQHLAAIGIQATLNLPEWGQRVTLGNRGQYEVAVFGTSADNNDPDGMQTVLDGELPPTYGRSYAMPTPKHPRALRRRAARVRPRRSATRSMTSCNASRSRMRRW